MVKWNNQTAYAMKDRTDDKKPRTRHLSTPHAAMALGRRLRARWASDPARSASALMIGMR